MTKPISAVFLDVATLGQDVSLSPLEHQNIEWTFYDHSLPEQVLERISQANLVICNKVVLSSEVINQCPELQLICVAATGMNNIDLTACKKAGIKVNNVENYAGSSVAQHVFALMLELASNAVKYDDLVKSGRWSKSRTFCMFDYPMIELSSKTLGLIGYGSLAKSVEKIAHAFDMQVLVAEHKEATTLRHGRSNFQSVLKNSDFISVHCPLTDSTTNLIADKELHMMKASAFIINTARGGIINEPALVEALKNRTIAGAAVDVLSVEPPPNEHPLLSSELDNLIVTPHIAWATKEARQRLVNIMADKITSYFHNLNKTV